MRVFPLLARAFWLLKPAAEVKLKKRLYFNRFNDAMKPFLKLVDTSQNNAFQVIKVCQPMFYSAWHFHPECEIMLVREGTGMRFTGDNIERFQPGDVVLFGPGIPHSFRSDEEYYQEQTSLLSKSIVVYFKENFAGNQLWELPEMAGVKRLLAAGRRGIKFVGNTRDVLEKLLVNISEYSQGVDRIIDLLTILKRMAESEEYVLLSGSAFAEKIDSADCVRINEVYDFILKNYADNPSLDDVAKIACMSTTAFCRYFKTHTNKTYVQFLNEVKISNASKMIVDNKLPVSRICYEVGFNNFNHFTKLFKRIAGFTPGQYQQQFIKSIRKAV